MIINLVNNSSITTIVKIEDLPEKVIQPYESISIELGILDNFKLIIAHNYESSSKKNYNLVLESKYRISEVIDGEVFYITREKINVSYLINYDRFFLASTKSRCTLENNNVIGEKNIKKEYTKDFWKENLIFELIFNVYPIIIFLVLCYYGISISKILGLVFALIYFPISYLLVVSFVWIIRYVVAMIFKPLNDGKIENADIYLKKKYFYKYFEEDFIKNYYSLPLREPFIPGKIEF